MNTTLHVARALSMHTFGPDSAVGLLLFDEPGAALDPVAEHGTCSPWHFPFSCKRLAAHKLRPFLMTSRISPEEDNGLLDPPIRKAKKICGHHIVRHLEPQTMGYPLMSLPSGT